MTKKGILIGGTLSFGVVGILFFIYPFIAALAPVERIPKHAYKIDISDLQENTSKLIITKESKEIVSQHSIALEPGSSLLVVRGDEDNYYLYMLPIWEGNVMMPWRVWGQHEGYCPDFGLGKHNGVFTLQCGTPDYAKFLTKQWYWTITGVNLGDDLPDLMRIHFVKDGSTLYAYQYLR